MDMYQVASFFDLQDFDEFDPATGTWYQATIKGQLKLADKFVAIWNRPTRNRMMYFAPGNEPTRPVLRVSNTGDILMLKTPQRDTHANVQYRTVVGGHLAAGVAVVKRLLPVGPPENPGWAVEATVLTTYADVELRSVNESQDRELLSYGHFFMFLPRGTNLSDHDTVTLNGKTYYVLETYNDSGLDAARVTSKPDERVNMVYISMNGPAVYDPDSGENVEQTTTYNVTGKLTVKRIEDIQGSEISRTVVEVMIRKPFIGLVPKIGDKISFMGKTYIIESVGENSLRDEWVLGASE